MANQIIELPGKGTPNIQLQENEELLMDVSQGVRDLGLVPKILGHKGRLIVTNKRAVLLEKKTKDYTVSQLKLSLTSLVRTSHEYMAKQMITGVLLLIAGIFIGVQAHSLVVIIVAGLIGLALILTAKRQGLSLSSAAGSIFFASISTPKEELTKILTIVSHSE